ncbi:hydrogenase maturation nickel metallochaperone HypA/HybF [Aquabacterium sp. OR-4]|uniref:hydrogenase maturation nickel metallochaperone HypA/HybF n=1 Tax=Aquabacterium sp. OR-4 TaxID=2978127 RepID=UPI0021B3C40D|nr:hydrogenase maturation nickel metallochaperone HypA [Aquabacterium sp. OR-4]MDT7833621.1 hydrogenase maturation nickel metallochaperone HypA [Aquabacterium sp. OR-4]
MHEMSLAGGVLKVVEDAAAREHFARVKRLTLAAGALSGVEVRALRFALDAIAPGTCLDGAEIEILEPPAQAWCLPCAASVPIRSRLDACPHCGSHQIQPTSGTDLTVHELIVHDEPLSTAAPARLPQQET